ncbi:carbohydrate ABC transporter substrate-binding protein [Cyanobacteria bacterium FACHB-63]|nr:carbohydrate ABC transporter substrate-binding protein [Cyanobacteria bacterium FACHB-63]
MLSACGGQSAVAEQQTLTIWSSYPNQDVEILIKNYRAVHPEVEVIHTTYGLSNYFSFLKERMAQGLGPDIAIVPDPVLPALIDQQLVEDLEPYKLDTSNFYSKALISLRADDKHLYGVPFGFQTMALCYNSTQSTDIPTTLKAVLDQANRGKGIAIDFSFLSSVWGVGAMNGTFFNSIDQFTLEEQPLSYWLSWLKSAQQTPNVYVDNRRDVLADLFATGKVTYFPCWTFEIPALQKKLKSQLNVAVLPGNLDSAAPVLETDSLVLNAYATPTQKRLAFEFAKFLTRREQQLAFQSAQNTIVAPVNPKVLVDRRLLPIRRSLIEQVQNSFLIPIAQAQYRTARLVYYADTIYTQVMQGEMSPTEGAHQFITQIHQPTQNKISNESAPITSAAEIGNVQGEITPKADYLLQLFRIQFQMLRRPIILVQIVLFIVVLTLTWLVARRLNRFITTFSRRLIE